MKFKFSLIYTALFAGVSLGAYAETSQQTTEQLDAIEVSDSLHEPASYRSYSVASDGKLQDSVNLGLLGRATNFTAPVTVVKYDAKVIDDTQARTLVDVVAKKDASTWQFGGETNTLTGLYFRGYQLDARQFSVNGLAGMYGTQGTSSVYADSVQLIKGGNTALSGMDPEGATAGAVNIETKRASDQGNRKVGVGYFSDNRLQGTFDLGQRFGESKQFGVRVNGKMREGDTPRTGYWEDNKEFSLNADYSGDKLYVSFDSFYAKRKTEGGRARIQDIQNTKARLFDALDGENNLQPSWQAQDTRSQTNMLTFDYYTDYNFQISGGIGYNDARYYGNFASATPSTDGQSYNAGRSRMTDQRFQTLSSNLAARGEFSTGSVSHNWSTSFDHIDRRRQTYRGTSQAPNQNLTIYPYGNAAGQTLAQQLANIPQGNVFSNGFEANPNLDATIRANSLALSDTLGFAEDKFRVTLGGRFQWASYKDNIKQAKGDAHRFSPMFMVSYLPNPDLVFYGNYMEDLEPADIKTDDSGNTTMSKPRVSRQLELGVRKNWGDVVTSFNVFQVRREGYWRGNATRGTDFNTSGASAGDSQGIERNRGIEFNIYANLLDKTVRPSLGIMYLQSKVKDYPNYADNLVNGYQVANPRWVGKAGIEWDTPFIQGLTLSTNIQHFGKSYQDTQKTYAFPSYTLVDAGAKYHTKLGNGHAITVRAQVENLFNKAYWQVQRGQYDRSFAVLGMPRTYWTTVEYSF
ncbi:TonB-dependent receptor [Lonepinella sp. MS14435]|uniref:TonB-dependent receptor n=1 Tax=Lonepinella sp. MS14435 TaxID=3003618 RepID=UPI0036DBE131